MAANHSSSNAPAGTPKPAVAGAQIIALHSIEPAPGAAEALARKHYAEAVLGTGEPALAHAQAIVASLTELGQDAHAIAAGWLFAVPQYLKDWREALEPVAGADVIRLLDGLSRLHKLRDITRKVAADSDGAQAETLRKMLLAMVSDVRVVLIRLASRLQTLRYLTQSADQEQRRAVARETLDFYAPLANRLGVWQLKWALEDLSFRLLEPALYKQIASQLDAKRGERETYIAGAIADLTGALRASGVEADIAGRPKHIYSIYTKMRNKSLSFDELFDVRALRLIVPDLKDCYTALGVVHNLWQPIPKEFDDYISRPKGNDYRSLHTAVVGPDDLALEVQIRTRDMHRHAELGVAAHWRYKEAGVRSTTQAVKAGGGFDDKVALLRQLLAWRDEVSASVDGVATAPTSPDWHRATSAARLDDTIYVLTPQGRVVDLPQGATSIDLAYTLHTDLGHHCRGARVDGAMVPLDTPLRTGQTVEIIAAKTGGPSRDWLNPNLAYLATHRARTKVRQWFNALELQEAISNGRSLVDKELQREGRTATNLEWLAQKLGFDKLDDMFIVAARGEWSVRQIERAFDAPSAPAADEQDFTLATKKSKSEGGKGILIVGVDRLMTQLARCCKPAPPDAIGGFITRGRGVSIHRADCKDFLTLKSRSPERLIETQWGTQQDQVFPVDIEIEAHDRPGLLRDIGEILSREKINVTATRSQSRQQMARMAFTVEVTSVGTLQRTLAALRDVPGVASARRA